MQSVARPILFAVLLATAFAAAAKADTVYSYVGDTFTNVTGVYVQGDQVTGNFVLSGSYVYPNQGAGTYPVANFVSSYDFTDGHQTFTQANSTATIFVGFNPDGTPIVPTDASGINSNWYLCIVSPSGEILTEDLGGDYQTLALDGSSEAHILSINKTTWPGGPGTWSIQVPEGGATALYLFAGLTIFTCSIGRKRVARRL